MRRYMAIGYIDPSLRIHRTVPVFEEVWKHSMEETVVKTASLVNSKSSLASFVGLFLPYNPLAPFFPLVMKYARLLDIPWDGIRMYEDHNALIKRLVPAGNLLEFNAKEGWEPLCRLLEKNLPRMPFPLVNDRHGYHRNFDFFQQHLMRQALANMAWTFGSLSFAMMGMYVAGKAVH